MKRTNKEKKNERIGGITSFVVHVLFVLIALFLVKCWKAPGPPDSRTSTGLMIDVGISDVGSGEVEPDNDPTVEPQPETTEPEGEPQPEPTTNAVPQPVTPDVNAPAVENSDSPVSAGPESSDNKPEEDNKPEDQTTENDTPTDQTVDTPTEVDAGQQANQSEGANVNEMGNQGKPDSVNPDGVMTDREGDGDDESGGEDGAFNLKIGGAWNYNGVPKEDKIKHSGTIKFSFIVDEFGEITRIVINESSFTADEEKVLKNRIMEDLKFTPKSNTAPPEETKATLTWRFQAE